MIPELLLEFCNHGLLGFVPLVHVLKFAPEAFGLVLLDPGRLLFLRFRKIGVKRCKNVVMFFVVLQGVHELFDGLQLCSRLGVVLVLRLSAAPVFAWLCIRGGPCSHWLMRGGFEL